MGTSYDGVYFFGLLYDQYGEHDEPEGWPSVTAEVLAGEGESTDEDEPDFDSWLGRHLGVVDNWREDAPQEARIAAIHEHAALFQQRCIEVFGVEGFESKWMGHLDYPVFAVYPKGARLREWRGAAVPVWPEERVAVWRRACEQLRAVLPGAQGPGLYFGCQVG